jgi:S-adenosylmethionine/arginine decarboxylase-like enzyme
MQANMWNMSGWEQLKPHSELVEQINTDLQSAGFKILKFVDHEFEPHGYTALWLLAESHYAIHTFPEENTYYWELSSCVHEFYQRYSELKEEQKQ